MKRLARVTQRGQNLSLGDWIRRRPENGIKPLYGEWLY